MAYCIFLRLMISSCILCVLPGLKPRATLGIGEYVSSSILSNNTEPKGNL